MPHGFVLEALSSGYGLDWYNCDYLLDKGVGFVWLVTIFRLTWGTATPPTHLERLNCSLLVVAFHLYFNK